MTETKPHPFSPCMSNDINLDGWDMSENPRDYERLEETETYHIQVGHTIFWWNETRERAEELVRYYKGLYPDKPIQMIKNKEKL